MDPLQTPIQTEKTPAEMLQDVKNSFTDTAHSVLGDTTVQQMTQTASQVGTTVGQVSNLVVDQVGNLSQKIGGEELVGEVKTMVNPILGMIVEVLKIAFFIKQQARIGRGQYIVGSLASLVIVGLLVSILGVIIGPIGVGLGSLLIAIPLFNLAAKRFHDLNKSGRWAVTIVLPFIGWVMPSLFQGINGQNNYGPDPLIDDTADLTSYVITALSLLILSSIVTTILGFLGLRVQEPNLDISNPNVVGNQLETTTTPGIQQTKSSAAQTIDSATRFQ